MNWKPNSGALGAGGQEGTGPAVRLYPPEVDENPDGGKKEPPVKQESPPFETKEPPRAELPKLAPPKVVESVQPNEPAPTKPVGIQQFAEVKSGIATGLRPSLDDGLEWLKSQGYKTVLYIHEPGEPEAADRRQVEKRGMKFVGLAVSASTLSRQIADEFNRIVADSGEGPLFVYDRDGALTGSLWYLQFRLVQQATDASARNLSHRLGLEEERGGQHTEMWNAAKKLASEGFVP
jgi:protein tyrosine phosphatase (PTP) superfamily phosphohydrolase (DUF442 family)